MGITFMGKFRFDDTGNLTSQSSKHAGVFKREIEKIAVRTNRLCLGGISYLAYVTHVDGCAKLLIKRHSTQCSKVCFKLF